MIAKEFVISIQNSRSLKRGEEILWKVTGNGVIIIILDTGIKPSQPSFHDKGMLPPPTKWKGNLEFNHSSNKIIGATIIQGTRPSFDDDGHGTDVASIAAESVVCANLFA